MLRQVLVEKINVKGRIWNLDKFRQVIGVARNLANGIGLVLEEFLFNELRNFGIVVVAVVQVGRFSMDVVSDAGQLLFGVQGHGEGVHLIDFQDFVVGEGDGRRVLVPAVEVGLAAPLRDVLDQLDGLVPGLVGEPLEKLVESRTVLLVGIEMSSQQEVVVRGSELGVHVGLKFLFHILKSSHKSVALNGVIL